MPKVSVYLPDDLYRAARDEDLSISALTQEAVRTALRRRRTRQWVARVRQRPPRVASADVDTGAVMDRVRDEFGA
jgi:post-segregation antitoxin (ccd killing protein)